MKKMTVRGVTIGEGMPKIIAPIVGQDENSILSEAAVIRDLQADIAEWRIDHYTSGTDADSVIRTAGLVRAVLKNIPLLITFRTQHEGGASAISPEAYAQLLTALCRARCADMIDVEVFSHPDAAAQIIRCARENGVCVIASNHDFSATPEAAEILRRLRHMAHIGADIAKIAVMPRENSDVLTLLQATARAHAELDCPLITMSMGALGAVSRISGECFDSACTFGSAAAASAPGQIPVPQLRAILQALRQK